MSIPLVPNEARRAEPWSFAPEFPKVGEADFWRKAAVYERYQKDKALAAELEQQLAHEEEDNHG